MSEHENDDERLRAAMEVLRKDDAARAPSFEELRARPAARRPSPLRFVAPAVGTVAMAAAVLLWIGRRSAEPPASVAAGAVAPAPVAPAPVAPAAELAEAKPVPALSLRHDDVAPLDFLLDTQPAAYVSGGSASLDFLLEGPAR